MLADILKKKVARYVFWIKGIRRYLCLLPLLPFTFNLPTAPKAFLDSFEVEKFQTNLSPDKILSCNDKLTKILFCLSADEYFDVLQNDKSVSLTETISRGKKVQSHFKLNGGGIATRKRPFKI